MRCISILGFISLLVWLANAANAPPKARAPSPPPAMPPTYPPPAPPPPARVVPITLRVTVSKQAYDCTAKSVILVNGQFMPTIRVTQYDIVEITVINDLPKDYPSVAGGLTIHWHGLYMWNENVWADGVPYVSQCPIPPGGNYTYRFTVTDAPGTYMWHDHSAAYRADGLAGGMVIEPQDPNSLPYQVDGEHVLFLTDWWLQQGDLMAMQLNRPNDAKKVTKDSGRFKMVGNPQSIMINGRAIASDCSAGDGCAPKVMTARAETGQVCKREVLTVNSGSTYLIRIANAAASAYFTVCFEGHQVTILGADALPTTPMQTSCVDINNGERMDVMLVADQEPGNYWITVLSQFSSGAPNGYAVLRYGDADTPLAVPTTPAPQAGDVTPWTPAQWMELLTTHPDLANPPSYQSLLTDSPPSNSEDYMPADGGAGHSTFPVPSIFFPPSFVGYTSFKPPSFNANLTIALSYSMDMIASSGMVRWTINNVAMPEAPPCQPLLTELIMDPTALDKVLNASLAAKSGSSTGSSTAKAPPSAEKVPLSVSLSRGLASTTSGDIFDATQKAPYFASVGVHVARLLYNETVDLVISSDDGESHPIHMHGHKFWVMGMGYGTYKASRDKPKFNMNNPMYKDTITVPPSGWVVVRFLANNPGVWPLHCHNLWHSFAGQKLFLVEAPEMIQAPPKGGLPKCASTCRASFFPYPKSWVSKAYGKSGFVLPKRKAMM